MADFGSPLLPLPDMEPERQRAFSASLDLTPGEADGIRAFAQEQQAPAPFTASLGGGSPIDQFSTVTRAEPAGRPAGLPAFDAVAPSQAPTPGPSRSAALASQFSHPNQTHAQIAEQARMDRQAAATTPTLAPTPLTSPGGFALAPDRPQGAAPAPAQPRPDYGRMMETGKQKTVASTELSPEFKETMAEKDRLGEEQIAAVDKQADVDKERANVLAEGQATLAKLADDWQKEDKRLTAEGDALVRQKAEEHDKFVKEHAANSKYTSLTSRLGTGQKIALAIAHMFGGLSQGLTGAKVNPAAEAWRQIVQDDFEIYRQNLQTMDDRVAMARTGMKDAKEAKESLLIDSYRNQEALLRKADADIRKRLAQTGMSEADIAKDARVLAIRQDILEQRQRALEPTNRRIQETTNTARVQNRAAAQGQAQGHFVFDANGKPIAGLPDKAQAHKLNKSMGALRSLQYNLRKLRENIDKNGYEIWDGSEASQERDSLKASIAGDMKEMKELGTLDNGVERNVNATIGADVSLMKSMFGTPTKGIDTAIDSLQVNGRNILNSSGLPAETFYAPIVGQQAPSTAGGKRGTYRGQVGTLMPDNTFIPDS